MQQEPRRDQRHRKREPAPPHSACAGTTMTTGCGLLLGTHMIENSLMLPAGSRHHRARRHASFKGFEIGLVRLCLERGPPLERQQDYTDEIEREAGDVEPLLCDHPVGPLAFSPAFHTDPGKRRAVTALDTVLLGSRTSHWNLFDVT